jgi:hypothetical protein
MDEFEKHERKRQAWMRLRAQRRRAGQLRGRVVALTLITFALLWGIVFAQMTTGHDPVLGDAPHTDASGGSARQTTTTTAQPEASAQTDAEIETEELIAAEEEAFAAEEAAEAELFEEEPVENEIVEPEPEPVITGQS